MIVRSTDARFRFLHQSAASVPCCDLFCVGIQRNQLRMPYRRLFNSKNAFLSLSLSIYLSDAGALVSLQQTLNTVCVSSYRSLTVRVRWMRRRDADIVYMQRCGVAVGVRVAAVGHRQHGGHCRLHGQHAATVRRHKIARALLDASSERRSIKI